MKLSIIIINYKTPDLTSSSIDKSYISFPYEIIVVDNNSQVDSRAYVDKKVFYYLRN